MALLVQRAEVVSATLHEEVEAVPTQGSITLHKVRVRRVGGPVAEGPAMRLTQATVRLAWEAPRKRVETPTEIQLGQIRKAPAVEAAPVALERMQLRM